MSLSEDTTNDLDIFLNSDEFAIEAVFITATSLSTIKVIFDNETEPIINIDTGGVTIGKPQAIAKTEDVIDAKGKTLVVNNVTYNIIESKNNGTGLTTLILSKD